MSDHPAISLEISSDAEALLTHSNPLDVLTLQNLTAKAIPLCTPYLTADAVLPELSEIEITLLSDAEIAAVHGEFLQDPTPTDVITFHHGEILISVETAQRQALAFGKGQSLQREIALYIVHGLIHLAGHDDHDPDAAAHMARLQESVLEQAESC